MIRFRFTRKTILNTVGLCIEYVGICFEYVGICLGYLGLGLLYLGTPIVFVLAILFTIKALTVGETPPKAPDQNISQTEALQGDKTTNSSESRDYVIPSFGTDDSVLSAGSRRKLAINGVEFVFRWIPEGTFIMGSPHDEVGRSNDEVQHEVKISQGFWALETEVTQGMWSLLMGVNPSRSKSSKRLPVENVSWNDCQRYVEKLNALNLCPKGYEFALPTETQWEYACRAGTTTPFSLGAVLNDDDANCDGSKPYGAEVARAVWGATRIVGSYQANPWGLYDMHGNVAEWTADWYGDYPKDETTDTRGPEQGSNRVYRGGSWSDGAASCRSACRASARVNARADGVGLRLVLVKTDKAPPTPTSDDDDAFTFLDAPSKSDAVTQAPEPQSPKTNSTPSDSVKTSSNTENSNTRTQRAAKSWSDSSSRKPGYRQTLTIDIESIFPEIEGWSSVVKEVEFAFRWIPAGSFMMGSPQKENGRKDDEDQHETRITQGFWILETEVTLEIWEDVMNDNPNQFNDSRLLPVENVSWNDCQRFLTKINSPDICPEGVKFALPTEAQWEYACRAGTTTPFSFGNVLNWDYANCNGNYPYGADGKGERLGKTQKVGSYPPNAWGLFDMHGNVWEWTSDWYALYPKDKSIDPTGPENGSHRVNRGGCWLDDAVACRAARRHADYPDYHSPNIGFRLILVPDATLNPNDEVQEKETLQ